MEIDIVDDGHPQEFPVGSKARELFAAIRSTSAYADCCRNLAAESGFDRHSGRVSDEAVLGGLVAAWCSDPDGVPAWLAANGLTRDPAAFYDSHVAPGVALVRDAVVRRLGLSPDAGGPPVAAGIRADVVAEMGRLPCGDWRRMIPSGYRVELCHVPGLAAGGDPDGLRVSHWAGAGAERPDTVIPDAAFERLLRFVNVSSEEFVAALVKTGRRDPLADDFAAGFPDGPDAAAAAAAAALWRRLGVRKDVDVPPLLSPSELVGLVSDAGSGGSPVLVCRARFRELLERPASMPLRVTGGGMVGLHDFSSGRGAVEPPRADVALPGGAGWMVAAPDGQALHALHDIAPSLFDARAVDAPDWTPWSRVDDGEWTRDFPGGRVVIARSLSVSREDEYWVRTVADAGSPRAPRSAPEVWIDLADAIRHGDVLHGESCRAAAARAPFDAGLVEKPWSLVAAAGARAALSVAADGREEFLVASVDAGDAEAGPQPTPEAWVGLAAATAEGDRLAALDWSAQARP